MTFYPECVNQFRQKDGTPWGLVDGFSFNSSNCTMTAATRGVAFARMVETPTITPNAMRKASGDLDHAIPGSTVQDAANGMEAFGVASDVFRFPGIPWEELMSRLTLGWGAVLATWQGTVPRQYRCSSFAEGHAWWIQTPRVNVTTGVPEVFHLDSLCTRGAWIPQQVARESAEFFSRKYGSTGAFVALVSNPDTIQGDPMITIDPKRYLDLPAGAQLYRTVGGKELVKVSVPGARPVGTVGIQGWQAVNVITGGLPVWAYVKAGVGKLVPAPPPATGGGITEEQAHAREVAAAEAQQATDAADIAAADARATEAVTALVGTTTTVIAARVDLESGLSKLAEVAP